MRRKTSSRRAKKTNTLTDLEVAKKMIKIFQSAVDRKLEFDLSFITVKKLLLEPSCYYTGKKFEETGVFARSFDRVDSDLGYVEGNVVACTVDINSKKSNLTFEEIENLYKVLQETQIKKEPTRTPKKRETSPAKEVNTMEENIPEKT
jgi:hypothetical protein